VRLVIVQILLEWNDVKYVMVIQIFLILLVLQTLLKVYLLMFHRLETLPNPFERKNLKLM